MKKIFILFFAALFSFVMLENVNAECNDEELNEWATSVEAVFTENHETGTGAYPYAYFLSIKPYREDIKIIVHDGANNTAEGQMFDRINLYGVGAFTNLDEETYTIEVYGNEKSACNDELLKTLTYTVPRYNRMVKDASCEKHPDLEICQTFTNSTKDMTQEEFNKIVEENEEKTKTTSDILATIISYLIFVIVPLAVISIIYTTKIKKFKKHERNK